MARTKQVNRISTGGKTTRIGAWKRPCPVQAHPPPPPPHKGQLPKGGCQGDVGTPKTKRIKLVLAPTPPLDSKGKDASGPFPKSWKGKNGRQARSKHRQSRAWRLVKYLQTLGPQWEALMTAGGVKAAQLWADLTIEMSDDEWE